MHGNVTFADASALCGFSQGPLDAASVHGSGGTSPLLLISPGGGKEPGGMSVRGPGVSEESEGVRRKRDVAVLGTLASVHVDHESLAVDVGSVEKESFVHPESQARDGGEVNLIVPRCGLPEKATHFLHTEDGWKAACGLSLNEVEYLPVALQDVSEEESDTVGADAHGVRCESINVFSMQDVLLWRTFT